MAHHIHCAHCAALLYCKACGQPADADAAMPGAVGKRHKTAAFDPHRKDAWLAERGRILLAMYDADCRGEFLLARELWSLTSKGGSPNQTCTRLGELAAQGLVRRTGRERDTTTGSPADEWMLTDPGRAIVRGDDVPPAPPGDRLF